MEGTEWCSMRGGLTGGAQSDAVWGEGIQGGHMVMPYKRRTYKEGAQSDAVWEEGLQGKVHRMMQFERIWMKGRVWGNSLKVGAQNSGVVKRGNDYISLWRGHWRIYVRLCNDRSLSWWDDMFHFNHLSHPYEWHMYNPWQYRQLMFSVWSNSDMLFITPVIHSLYIKYNFLIVPLWYIHVGMNAINLHIHST